MKTISTRNRRSIAIVTTYATSLIGFRGPLIQAICDYGPHVYTLAPDFDPRTRKAVQCLGAEPVDISLSRTGMNPAIDARECYRISQLLRRIKPDVFLGYFIKPVIFGSIAAWLARVPYRVAMIEGLGFVFTEDERASKLGRRLLRKIVSALYRFALDKTHTVIFLNPDDLRDFVHLGIVDAGKAVELGGIGVDLEEWPQVGPVTAPIRFLFVGRLLKEKGIHDFVEAARIVRLTYPEVQFAALGDVDANLGSIDIEQMQAWVDEGLLDWPGHVAVKPWIEKSSVFVLPSYYREGIPRSTQEAMAMGRPIITTDTPGCRQTVENDVNGFLVPARDPEALAVSMKRFIEKPELIAAMGEASRQIAEERFDVHKVNEKFMSILGFDQTRN